jgi:hypothetical protein
VRAAAAAAAPDRWGWRQTGQSAHSGGGGGGRAAWRRERRRRRWEREGRAPAAAAPVRGEPRGGRVGRAQRAAAGAAGRAWDRRRPAAAPAGCSDWRSRRQHGSRASPRSRPRSSTPRARRAAGRRGGRGAPCCGRLTTQFSTGARAVRLHLDLMRRWIRGRELGFQEPPQFCVSNSPCNCVRVSPPSQRLPRLVVGDPCLALCASGGGALWRPPGVREGTGKPWGRYGHAAVLHAPTAPGDGLVFIGGSLGTRPPNFPTTLSTMGGSCPQKSVRTNVGRKVKIREGAHQLFGVNLFLGVLGRSL